MTAPITRTHRLAVARAWENDERLCPAFQRWAEDGSLESYGVAHVRDYLETLERLAQLVADTEGVWIPCDERVSTNGEWVLLWLQNRLDHTIGSCRRGYWEENRGTGSWRDEDGSVHGETVTHWRSLPKPPEQP